MVNFDAFGILRNGNGASFELAPDRCVTGAAIFILYQDDRIIPFQPLGPKTPVVAATLDQCLVNVTEQGPFEYRVSHFDPLPESSSVQCVAFDEISNTWSNEGIQVVSAESNSSLTTCRSTHLTNFAVLTQLGQVEASAGDSGEHGTALSAITTIGCCVSILALGLTIAIYLYLPKVRKSLMAHLLLCLCGTLLMGFVLFLTASYVNPGKGCEAVGVLLQV